MAQARGGKLALPHAPSPREGTGPGKGARDAYGVGGWGLGRNEEGSR